MERFAVCVNDVEQARRVIVPMLATAPRIGQCLVLSCPPRLGRRIGRFTSAAARRQWRDDWAAELRGRLEPALSVATPQSPFAWVTPSGPLAAFIRELRRQHGAGLRLVDARCHPPGAALEPMTDGEARPRGRLAAPMAVASSLSLMLALTD